MKYERTQPAAPFRELWQEKSVRRLSGGFNIVLSDGLSSSGWLKKGAPIAINFATRNATLIKTVALTAALGAAATAVQVAKGKASLYRAGEFIGTKTKSAAIANIDTSNNAYDVINLSEAIGAVPNGGILTNASGAGANALVTGDIIALNYADVKLDGQSACTGIIQAYEVKLSLLPYPLTDDIKTALTSRFIFMP